MTSFARIRDSIPGYLPKETEVGERHIALVPHDVEDMVDVRHEVVNYDGSI